MDKKNTKPYNKNIARHVESILKLLNVELNDENFKETPRRFTQLLEDFFKLNNDEIKQRVDYLFTRKFKSSYDGIVCCKNIVVFGLCPHHLSPIKYVIHFFYIPRLCVLGLSKIIDIIKLLSKYPKLQEDFTNEITDVFYKKLRCKGTMCIINGEHSCLQIRDVEARETSTITSAVCGIFDRNVDGCKDEALRLCNGG